MKKTALLKKAIALTTAATTIICAFGTSAAAYDAIRSTSSIVDSGYYRIRHLNSGKFLDVLGMKTDEYATLGIVHELPENRNQVYKITRQNDGYYVISPCHVDYMALAASSYDDCSYIVQTYYTGDANQKWAIQANSNGSFTFVNALTENCLNVYGNGTANDTPIISYHADGTTAEQFDILSLTNDELITAGLIEGSVSETYTVNSCNGVNVRLGAGTGYGRVGAARNGISFEVTQKDGSWGYTGAIQCTNGWQSGWVNLDYCTLNGAPSYQEPESSGYSAGLYSVNSSNGVNVRKGADTSYGRCGAARNGITFTVDYTDGSWGYTGSIQCTNGWQAGWVNLDYCTYLSDYSENTPNTPSYNDGNDIHLDVPHYLQSDRRWRSTKLPGSNCTIWGSGCTITGLAMMYSYNNGCTMYPNEIINYLNFTSGGAVYWRGVYNLGFSRKTYSGSISQGCMSSIYEQLSNGRPVMVGATNSYGDEHWVVVTGYSGSTDWFNASGFSINDPAGNHSTLQEYLGYVDRVNYIVY